MNIDTGLGNTTASNNADGFRRALATLNSDIYVNGDASLLGRTALNVALNGQIAAFNPNNDIGSVLQHVKSLTFADLGANAGPTGGSYRDGVSLLLFSMYVNGTTALGAHANNIQVDFGNPGNSVLGGQVTGGQLNKYGNGLLFMASGTNNYSGGTVIWAQGINTATSIVGSLTRTGTPFGTGDITINPGAQLRIADVSNISGNNVTLKTDGGGLGGIGLAYNGVAPTINGVGGPGVIKLVTTGDYDGVLSLDVNNYTQALNLNTLANGKMWLGSSLTGNQTNYFSPTLTAGAPDTVATAPVFTGSTTTTPVYRLGGGGNQGQLIIGANAFENVLTGLANVQIGAVVTPNAASQLAYINGNIGNVQFFNRNNLAAGSKVFLNRDSSLVVGNAFALGDATLVLNQSSGGGSNGLQLNAPIRNNVQVISDTFLVFGGNVQSSLLGNVDLSPSGIGGTRTFSIQNTDFAIEGVISGAVGSNIIKTGNNNMYFNGVNTYQGTTTISAAGIWLGTSALPNVAGSLGISDTPVLMAGNLGLAGQITVGRDIIVTGNSLIRAETVNNSVISGGINVASGATLRFDSRANSATSFQGGLLDLQGPISGAGAIALGNDPTTGVNAPTSGTIRLSANINGIGTSTYTGGTTLRQGRIQIAADTLYTGTAAAPTAIISGPFGSGSLTFGTGGFGDQGWIEAYGADRVVVNALGTVAWNGNTVLSFGNHNNLTFTSALNINSENTAGRARTFAVAMTNGVVTFSGNITTSAANGVSWVKNGSGTLVLTGTNTQAQLATGDANYGTGIFLDNGILQVNADAALGQTTTLAAAGPHIAGPADLRMRGGVLQPTASFNTSRQLIFTAASGIDVGPGLTLGVNQVTAGAFALTKTGAGVLQLNPAVAGSLANTITTLTIGGSPLAFTAAGGSALQLAGTGGGTVSTTATGGTPFATSTVAINGGTLSLVGGAVAQALTIPTVTFGSGSYIQLNKSTTGSALTATALTRVNQGTLTILPSALANLGAGAAATNEDLITSTAYANTLGMLTSPVVYARLAGVGQDADFVQYGGANGFSLRAANAGDGTTVLATTAAGNALIAASATPDSTQVAAQTVNAVRTSADLASPTQTLTIASGGLIMNRNTASANAGVTISTNLVFGASAAAPAEALIYVADGTTTTPTISGNFTATNFTKSGPGTLLVSSIANVMAPVAGNLRTLQINEGTLQFAGQSSLPSNRTFTVSGDLNGANAITSSQIIISPMDTGKLDLNGQNLTIAGLGGNAVASAATGNVINSGAAATLTVAPQQGTTSIFNGQIAGNIALSFKGVGSLTLGYNNTYSGGTAVGVGNITSGTGIFTPVGTLTVNDTLSLGTGNVSLAGGILNVTEPLAGPEMINNLIQTLLGPGNGYNVTVAGTNSLNSANTTSQISTNGVSNWQGINNLTMTGSTLTIGGASTSGIAVNGVTALSQATTFNLGGGTGSGLYLGGQITGGQSITKIGGQVLYVVNTAPGAAANDVSAWNVMAGSMEVRLSQGDISNPLKNGTTIQLDGGTLLIKHDADNLSDTQIVTTFASNNLLIGSATAVNDAAYTGSGNAILDLRGLIAGNNKHIQLNQLQFGGPLGAAFLSFNAGNQYTVEFLGALQMLGRDAALSLNNDQFTITGAITGNGTLFKQGGAELYINNNGTGITATGGTVLAGGNTYFGKFEGSNIRTLNPNATLPGGDITVQPNSIVRFTAATNIVSGQFVDVRSNLGSLGVVGIAGNGDSAALGLGGYDIRVPNAGGQFVNNMLTAPRTGSGVLAINSLYNNTIDLAHIGDGTFFLGSVQNGEGQNGTYNGAALTAGASYNGTGNTNNTYRLGGGTTGFTGSLLYIGMYPGAGVTSTPNLLTGNANLVVGTPLTNGSATNVNLGQGSVVLQTANNYAGATVVNVNSQLEFRGQLATSGFEVFGQFNSGQPNLIAGGLGGTFFTSLGADIPVNMHPGSMIMLDNIFELTPVASTQGRWGDTSAVNLNGSIFQLRGSSVADVVENVGQINVAGQGLVRAQNIHSGRTTALQASNIVQTLNRAGSGDNGSVSIEPSTANQLGLSERVFTTGSAATIQQVLGVSTGMVAPWIWNRVDSQFLTYGEFGFTNAGFNVVQAAATLSANQGLVTDRLQTTGAVVLNSGVQLTSFAARLDGNVTLGTATDSTAKLILQSGGLINGTNNIGINAGIVAGAIGSPIELQVHNANQITIGDNTNPTTSGQISATNIVKDGAGTLIFDVEQQTFTGGIALNQGVITLNNRTTSPVANGGVSNAGGAGGTIFINGYNTTLNLNAGSTAAGGSFNNNVYLAVGNPLTNIGVNRIGTTTGVVILGNGSTSNGNLTFGGSSGDQGQTLTISQTNNQTFQVNGTVTLSGNSIFNTNTNTTLAMLTSGSKVTGSGTLIKEGGSALNLGLPGTAPLVSSDFNGGIAVIGGTLQATATAPVGGGNVLVNNLGNNNTITLTNGATLSVLVDSGANDTAKVFTFNNNNIVMAGNGTVNFNRNTANGSNNTVAFNKLTIGGQTLTINSGGNNYRGRFNNVLLTDLATLSPASTVDPDLNNVTDNGAGLAIIKNGAGWLFFNDVPTFNAPTGKWLNPDGVTPTFSGGVYVNPGAALRFGTSIAASSTAQAGTGTIYINPGGEIQLQGLGNINTAAGQKVDVRTATVSAGQGRVVLNSAFDPTSVLTPTSTGLLLLSGTFNVPLNMATIGDGTFQLGSTAQIQYTATSLGAGAPSPVDPTVGVYRLGGNNQNLFFTNTAGLFNDSSTVAGVFKNRVQIGSLQSNANTVWLNSGDANTVVNHTYTGGTTIARASTLRLNTTGVWSASANLLGTGAVDNFGSITMVGTASAKFNTFNFHPGSQFLMDGVNGATDFWGDTTPVALNGANFFYQSTSGQAGQETVGDVSFANGSRISIINPGAPTTAHVLTASNLTRVGNGTLVFVPGDTFGTNAANTDNFKLTSVTAPTTTNGMLPAYMVNGFNNAAGNSFLNVSGSSGAYFLINATDSITNLNAGITAGTDRVGLTAATTLVDNPVIYSLRTNNSINNGAGQFNTLTVSANATGGGLLFYGASTVQPNIKSGSTGQFELPIYAGAAVTLSGDISATGITKFGTGVLTIAKDQSDAARGNGNGYNKGWNITEGQLTVGAFGSLGNVGTVANPNIVFLGASQGGGAAQLNLNLNQGNTLNTTYTSGRIVALDNAVIAWDPQADDRTQTINDVQIQSTGGVLLDAQLRFAVGNTRKRSILETGVLSLVDAAGYSNGGAIINVAYGSNVSEGVSTGVSVASLSGSDRLTKWGAGTLYVRGDSTVSSTAADGTAYTPFTGNVSIEEGALQILNTKALGTGTVTVKRTGTLDINVVGYAGAPTYEAGSIERWSKDGARSGAGTVNLGGGTLQIANDQTSGSGTVQLNGGSIEGFLNRDSNIAQSNGTQGAVYRTISSGYSFVLNGNSFVGQTVTGGVNGLDSGVAPTVFSPFSNALTGVMLEIKGNISGVGSLTKQGFDAVTISGTNSYTGGTYVNQGWLRGGAANVLATGDPTLAPNRGTLSTTGGGVFDLNGYNQAAGALTSPSQGAFGTATFNQNGSGYITNSATQLNTLSIGTSIILRESDAALSDSSPAITLPTAVPGVAAGQMVSGPGILDGTYVGSVSGTTINLVNAAGNPVNPALTLACADLVFTPVNIYNGVIQYNIALTKTGDNVQVLNNINTYAGPTTITGGVLRAVDGQGIPTASNLTLNGGVYEIMGGAFSRAVGTGANQVQFPGGASGFSAFGAPVTVNLGSLVWGGANFSPAKLVLNAASATAPITFASGIDLNATGSSVSRTFSVQNSPFTTPVNNAATLTGSVTQSGAGAATFVKEGQGRLVLAATSVTSSSYTGGTTINDGVLQTGAVTQLPNTLLTVNSTVDGSLCPITTGTLEMAGFNQTVSGIAGTGGNAIITSNGGDATLTTGGSATTTYEGVLVDGSVGGPGIVSLTKNGSGTQILTGASTYTGPTTVSAGTLQIGTDATAATASLGATLVTVTNTGSSIVGSAPTASTGGTATVTGAPVLAGTGTVGGATTIGLNTSSVGVLRPGQAAGSADGALTFSGNLTVNNGSQIQLGITSTNVDDSAFITSGQSALQYLTDNPSVYTTSWSTATIGHDYINVLGTLTLGTGNLAESTIEVTASSYVADVGNVFKLLDWAGVGTTTFSGSFAHTGNISLSGNGDLSLPDLGPSKAWDTSAFAKFGVVAVVGIVPEPSRAMLMLFGLLALGLRRRRKMD